ncbi:hypothetical protein J2W14_003969 [Pseudarthrobacter oxydans]|nr:hypothetical protein [Pseudarthrobacter oxydans]MDP9984543.1 hypothetical protein [Pseudarthrobacter oxydans]
MTKVFSWLSASSCPGAAWSYFFRERTAEKLRNARNLPAPSAPQAVSGDN